MGASLMDNASPILHNIDSDDPEREPREGQATMWVNVYYTDTEEHDTLARVQEAHLIPPERGARAQAVVWLPGLGQLSLRRPFLLSFAWWAMVMKREPWPPVEMRTLVRESGREMT
jgi:hypothetical protein